MGSGGAYLARPRATHAARSAKPRLREEARGRGRRPMVLSGHAHPYPRFTRASGGHEIP